MPSVTLRDFALTKAVVEHGLGCQSADMSNESMPNIAKVCAMSGILETILNMAQALFADEIVYVVALAMIKVSILVMYCRVFPLRLFKIGAWVLSVITVVWSLIFTLLCK
ncbi:hypothetical protein ES702_02409 [subsurface metagenome]